MAKRGSETYQAKLAKYQARVERVRVAPVVPPVREIKQRGGPEKNADQRQRMRLLRKRIEFWTGLLPPEWAALPVESKRTIASAIRDYYEEIEEPRSPHGGMYGVIAEVYGCLPWRDWAHDARGVLDDGY